MTRKKARVPKSRKAFKSPRAKHWDSPESRAKFVKDYEEFVKRYEALGKDESVDCEEE